MLTLSTAGKFYPDTRQGKALTLQFSNTPASYQVLFQGIKTCLPLTREHKKPFSTPMVNRVISLASSFGKPFRVNLAVLVWFHTLIKDSVESKVL
jgi:hypothetical protein